MKPKEITDDAEKLLDLLPIEVKNYLLKRKTHDKLLEVVIDLGRIPEARYINHVETLGNQSITKKQLTETVNKIGKFGSDNRAGIERTLHRISAIRNRQEEIIGLTCRVGRALYGTVEIIKDLIESNKSLLLMGIPGIGKTTALREIARVMADDFNRRVVIIDTSNEIAGDGDIPHPAIGRARRMQVVRPEYQHKVMIEAVENHMPEVIVIDEIGTELEAQAARTIAERGVQLVATAHGNALANLVKNPTLSDLIGGIQSVTLGDEEARRRRTQKTVLERACEPTFPIAVEINSRTKWTIYKDVASTIDLILRGEPSNPEDREIKISGDIEVLNSNSNKLLRKTIKENILKASNIINKEGQNNSLHINKGIPNAQKESTLIRQKLKILCCGISKQVFDQAISLRNNEARWTEKVDEADVVLSIRKGLSGNQMLRKKAQELKIPIHVIKSCELHQVEKAIKRLLSHLKNLQDDYKTPQTSILRKKEKDLDALEECRLTVEKIVLPLRQAVELLPRNEKTIEMQTDLINCYDLKSDVLGDGEHKRIRIYPPN